MWRPSGWERFRPELLEAMGEVHVIYEQGVEDGADLILQALKARGIYHAMGIPIRWEGNISEAIPIDEVEKPGWIVWIPDE